MFGLHEKLERTTQQQWRSQNVDKSYAHQRETTGSRSEIFQLRPFSKWELLLKERICFQGSEFFPLRAVPYGMEKSLLPH